MDARARRGVPNLPNQEYYIEDLLVVVVAAIEPMKIMGRDLVKAAIRAFNVLWPNEPKISKVEVLVAKLMDSQTQLNLWRESAE